MCVFIIQIQRLSDAGEEALILTANISEDSTQVLGSENGEQFVLQSDLDLLKQQFLKYCRGKDTIMIFKSTQQPLYNTIVGVQAYFHVSYPFRVIKKSKMYRHIAKIL